MYMLIGSALLGVLTLSKKSNTTAAATPRGTQTGTVTTKGQTSKAGNSATPARANQGATNSNANQPWYTGALVAGGGLALTAGAKALTGLVSGAGDDGSEPDSSSDEVTSQVQDVPVDVAVNTNTDSEFYDVDPTAGQSDFYPDNSDGFSDTADE